MRCEAATKVGRVRAVLPHSLETAPQRVLEYSEMTLGDGQQDVADAAPVLKQGLLTSRRKHDLLCDVAKQPPAAWREILIRAVVAPVVQHRFLEAL